MDKVCLLLVALTLCISTTLVVAQYDDVRCKCICPPPLNRTVSDTKKVYVKPLPPIDCDCKHVVSGLPTDQCAQNDFCLRCKCSYESRNTTSVKIGVVFVICVVSLLLAYTGVWYCLEIFVHKNSDRRRTRALRTDDDCESIQLIEASTNSQESVNRAPRGNEQRTATSSCTLQVLPCASSNIKARQSEGDDETNADGHPVPSESLVPPKNGAHVSRVVKRARNQQQRWKVDVDLQRARVYEQHSLLN